MGAPLHIVLHGVRNLLEIAFQGRSDCMTEPDVLRRKINELMEWQRVAWRRIADPSITAFERREIRNHIKESDDALRYHLTMMSERLQRQARTVEDVGDGLANLNFRLLLAWNEPPAAGV
jgi:hypothetical protein